jgi:hypothetical protein
VWQRGSAPDSQTGFMAQTESMFQHYQNSCEFRNIHPPLDFSPVQRLRQRLLNKPPSILININPTAVGFPE